MTSSAFNPNEAVTFDLAYGHVHMDGAPTRVIVPADALVALCRAAGEDEAAAMGHAIGDGIGRRIAVRIAGGDDDRVAAVRKTSIEEVVNQLAGEIAVIGIGSLSAERWGKALVFIVDQSPLGEEGDELLATILQSALAVLVGQQARVLRLHREGVRARFLTVSGAVVEAVRARLERGEDWGSVLAALHQKGTPAQ